MNTACAVTIPVDAKMRIDTKSGYQQRGIAVDRRGMMDKLEEEPENSETIKTARTLSTAGIALSAIGGAAMGWPLGQFMAGELRVRVKFNPNALEAFRVDRARHIAPSTRSRIGIRS